MIFFFCRKSWKHTYGPYLLTGIQYRWRAHSLSMLMRTLKGPPLLVWQRRRVVLGDANTDLPLVPSRCKGLSEHKQLPSANLRSNSPFCISFQKETTSQGLGAHMWKAEYEGPWRIPRAEMISFSPVLWNLSHTLIYYGQWNGANYSHIYKTSTTKTLISPRGPIQSPNHLLPFLSCSLQPRQPPLPMDIHNKNPNKLLFALFLWTAARAPTLFGT